MFSVLAGDAALATMGRADFQKQWQTLYDTCTWATSAQSPAFVVLRCQVYRERAKPILVLQYQAEKLVGLLVLAIQDGWTLGAGCEDSEYHVWLALRDHAETFMPGALAALNAELDLPPVWLKYVPRDVTINWASSGRFRYLAEVLREETVVLPLTDRASVLEFVHSKRRLRSKRNSLGRLGQVTFRRVHGVTDFERILERFDQMSVERKGEKFGHSARIDPFKRAYLAARQAVPGLQHTTVLELDGNPVAAHIGIEGRKGGTFSLAGITHDPAYDKYSPGALLLAELIPHLCDEGYAVFDLTPGGDAYKKHWGDRIEPVYQIRLYPNIASRGLELARSVRSRVSRTLAVVAEQRLNVRPQALADTSAGLPASAT